jgi:biotin transport system substrate-specific component
MTTLVNPTHSKLIQKINTRVVIRVLAATLALAISAQIAVPLPFTPVPMTLQTLALFVVAYALSWRESASTVLLYLGLGTIGAPVFAGFSSGLSLFGPTGGYLMGFLPAAVFVSLLRPNLKKPSNSPVLSTLGRAFLFFVASFFILGLGALQLSFFINSNFVQAIKLGVLPFLLGDVVKVLGAAVATRALKL